MGSWGEASSRIRVLFGHLLNCLEQDYRTQSCREGWARQRLWKLLEPNALPSLHLSYPLGPNLHLVGSFYCLTPTAQNISATFPEIFVDSSFSLVPEVGKLAPLLTVCVWGEGVGHGASVS